MKKSLDLSQLIDDSMDDEGPSLAELRQKSLSVELMQGLLAALSKPQAAPQVTFTAPEIPAPVVHFQPAAPAEKPVLDWTFDFIRNADGTIKSIRAKAT